MTSKSENSNYSRAFAVKSESSFLIGLSGTRLTITGIELVGTALFIYIGIPKNTDEKTYLSFVI